MIPGTMSKSHIKIYGVRYGETVSAERLGQIDTVLTRAYESLRNKDALERIWSDLRSELGWSAVMISKCLHFLARAAECGENVPVPIDNAMSRNWFWPRVKQAAKKAGINWPHPGGIRGNEWEDYNRYLTLLTVWAKRLGWSIVDLETALFAKWREPQTSS